MKCRNCGHEIPSGKLHCWYCGKEVRIVPDYNPLDDVLAAQVKGAIDGTDSPLDDFEYRKTVHKKTQSQGQSKKQSGRKKALKRRRRKRIMTFMSITVVVIIAMLIISFFTSYGGQVRRGNRALNSRDYTSAEAFFEKAIDKKPKKAEAYTGLAYTYMAQNKKDKALKVFEEVVAEQENNVAIHEACIQFYLGINENNRIPLLLDSANDKICNSLKNYIINKPKFSLDADVVYDDVQQLSLTSDYDIYYTLDGTEPTLKSTKYKEPIQIPEDETIVKAIAVTEDGVPSMIAKKTYLVELPIEDAPAVSPSTGQYDEAMKISIVVPEGYTAYYTLDKSEPDENSTIYTGPIDMPSGSTIFKAVLINAKGRLSDVTTRNYELTIGE